MAELDPISASVTAVQARLQAYFLPKVWDFSIVPDPLSIEEFKALAGRRTPFLALGWRQFNPQQTVGRRFQGELGLRLTIVVKHPQDARKRFLGDAKGPGLFPAMSAAVALVNGFTAPEIGTFTVTAISQAYAEGYGDHNCAIATIDIGTTVVIGDVTGAGAATPDFLSMLSAFEPWPDGQGADAPIEVRPAP